MNTSLAHWICPVGKPISDVVHRPRPHYYTAGGNPPLHLGLAPTRGSCRTRGFFVTYYRDLVLYKFFAVPWGYLNPPTLAFCLILHLFIYLSGVLDPPSHPCSGSCLCFTLDGWLLFKLFATTLCNYLE